jgi:protein-S-isoprenylcysteine O-methyltransferase Ste14
MAANVIRMEMRRAANPARSRRIVKAAVVLAFCLLGLIGSFADSAVARTGLLLVSPTDDPGNFDNLTATLVWATIANLAVSAGVVMVAYWLLSRPSAQVVELRAQHYKGRYKD